VSPSDVKMLPANDVDDENDDLPTKLRKKLQALKEKRSKPGAAKQKSSVEKQRLKRKLSKAKLKERRKKEKLMQNTNNQSNGLKSVPGPTPKPIFNKEGKMVFSKFDFSDSGTREESEKKKKSGLPVGKNYKQLLDKVHKQKDKLEKLEKVDKEKAAQVKESMMWKTAISKAEGVKVKDNEELLRKSLKKKEKRTEKGKKDWKRREENVERKKKGAQEKRKQNLMKRRDARQEKVKKRNKKKGRLIPGF